jgi:hypothetical protein
VDRWRRRLALVLGIVFIVAGIFETIRAARSGDGGIPFWFGGLCGGGALILVATFALAGRRWLSFALTAAGCLTASLATAWTLFMPIFAIALLALALLHALKTTTPGSGPAPG